jgi:hypothetical protein
MKMWLDDVRPAPEGWVHVKTVAQAQALMRTGMVVEASLDHDLGACPKCIENGDHIGDMTTPETTFMNWCKHWTTGYDLVVWMADTGLWPKQKPKVHSANPVGRLRMQGVIERYWVSPSVSVLRRPELEDVVERWLTADEAMQQQLEARAIELHAQRTDSNASAQS